MLVTLMQFHIISMDPIIQNWANLPRLILSSVLLDGSLLILTRISMKTDFLSKIYVKFNLSWIFLFV